MRTIWITKDTSDDDAYIFFDEPRKDVDGSKIIYRGCKYHSIEGSLEFALLGYYLNHGECMKFELSPSSSIDPPKRDKAQGRRHK